MNIVPKHTIMNFPRLTVVVAVIALIPIFAIAGTKEIPSSKYNPQVVKQRLERMESIVNVKYTDEVAEYIKAYLTNGRTGSGIIQGYGKVYFPAIEYNIQLDGLPDDLKYLSVIESSLRPYATSTAGAAGLWQIMPNTARLYGLVIDDYVDERRDPYRSTEVALKYLQHLYQEFHSWELAMAAYNCGPGRLKQAIRDSGGQTDFWKLRPFLPQETANYLPRYIAASYMMKYGFLHGIVPILRDPTMLNTSAVIVYSRLGFHEIEDASKTKYSLIRKLNSMYFKGVIPASDYGHFVTLPQKASKKLSIYLNKKCNSNFSTQQYRIFTYTIKDGDSLGEIGEKFDCSAADLRNWNNLRSSKIFVGQRLTIKVPLKRA